jgi:fermentation-respiration switch protein FrsA (DUF1100 family)
MSLLLNACSALLYHPSDKVFWPAENFGLQAKDIHFENADGVRLHAWLLEPKKVSKPWVFVLFHGNAENLTSHYAGLSWTVEMGARLFVFDYQGYGQSTGEPSPKGTVQDGIAALLWVHQNFPQLNLIVVGQSLGGAIAVRSLQELDHHRNFPTPSALILEGSFSSYQSAGVSVLRRSWLTWMIQPLAYVLLSDSWAPQEEMFLNSRNLKTSKLVIHNEADPVIDFALGEELFQALPEPKQLWRIPAGRHMDTFWRQEPNYRKHLWDWLNCSISGTSCPPNPRKN